METVVLIRTNSFSSRLFKEANSLKNRGYFVKILCWDRSTNKSRIEQDKKITVNYFGRKAPYGKINLIPYLFIWWAYEFIWLLKNEYDIIHACGFDAVLPAILVKILKQKKLVYDIFDFYAEALPSDTPKKIMKYISYFEKFCLRFADGIIIVDNSRYTQIKGAKIKNLEIIMNCPNDTSFEREHISKNNKYTIFYGGMISKTRGLDQLIDAIKDETDVSLIIAGNGEDVNTYRPIFNQMENVTFMGSVPYEEAIDLTKKADVIFGYYDPIIPNNRLASPNKLFEAMMCSTPILINEETSMTEIVKEKKCGIINPYNDTIALKNSIIELKNNPELSIHMGKNGREAFEKTYNWGIMETKLVNLYEKIK